MLGRYGDLYMALKQIHEPCIVACLPEFSQIVHELFPQHTVFQLPKVRKKKEALELCQLKFPNHFIVSAQQDGCEVNEYIEFRNYQSYQIFHANRLQEGVNIS